MSFQDDLRNAADNALSVSFSERDGKVVPETADVLSSQAVKLDAVFLYADLAGSSKLADVCPWETTAKIIRCYLDLAVRIIRANNGHIRSFDGDRVMGVFLEGAKNTNAADCAREIDWAVYNILRPKAEARFQSLKNNNISLNHCVGVAGGVARAVRAGIRNNNDLIWIGQAPSFAAKLSDIRSVPYEVYISEGVYTVMADPEKAKTWISDTFTFAGKRYTVYKTSKPKAP